MAENIKFEKNKMNFIKTTLSMRRATGKGVTPKNDYVKNALEQAIPKCSDEELEYLLKLIEEEKMRRCVK